jgi:hypothetical protein
LFLLGDERGLRRRGLVGRPVLWLDERVYGKPGRSYLYRQYSTGYQMGCVPHPGRDESRGYAPRERGCGGMCVAGEGAGGLPAGRDTSTPTKCMGCSCAGGLDLEERAYPVCYVVDGFGD